jgi:hypothetical protein
VKPSDEFTDKLIAKLAATVATVFCCCSASNVFEGIEI